MKPAEYDALLGRLDERSESTIRELTVQSKHLAKINDSLQKHQNNLVALNTTVYGKGDDKGQAWYVNVLAGRVRKLTIIGAAVVTALTVSGILEWRDVIHIFG